MDSDSYHTNVSVIIPAYNAERFVRSAIESVLNQTYQEFEVVVVNDGSTDGTAAVVQSFGSRVRCISQANGGPSAARNTGILGSSGQILAFLDADDMWMPDFLKMQMAMLARRPEVGGSYSWARMVDESGRPLSATMCPRPGSDTLRRLFVDPSAMFAMLTFRRAAFQKAGMFDSALRQAEDWDLLLRMAAAGIRFACIPRVLAQRRIHLSSATADAEQSLHWEHLALQKALSTLNLPPDVRALVPAVNFRMFVRAAMGHWRQGAREPAVRRLMDAFAAWPEALHRPQTYVGLIARLRPADHRGDEEILQHLESLTDEATQLLHEVFRHPELPAAVQVDRRFAFSALHAALAVLYVRKGHWRSALSYASRSLFTHPMPPLKGAVSMMHRAAVPPLLYSLLASAWRRVWRARDPGPI